MIDLNKYFSTNQDESKTDFFPLMSNEDEEKIEEQITTTRSLFLSKWGHPFICQLNESDLLFIKWSPRAR